MKRKFGAVVLMLLMLVALIAPDRAIAATSLKLSKAKATMEVDSKLTLKLGDITATEVKWSSSAKKVAIVSTKGVITAKGEGSATITAKYDDKSSTCKVTVVDSNKEENKIESYLKKEFGSTKVEETSEGMKTKLYASGKSLVFAMTFEEYVEIDVSEEELEEAMDAVFEPMEELLDTLLEELQANTYKDAKIIFRIYNSDKTLLYQKVLK